MVNEPPLASAPPPNFLVNVAPLLARVVFAMYSCPAARHDAGKQCRYIHQKIRWRCAGQWRLIYHGKTDWNDTGEALFPRDAQGGRDLRCGERGAGENC